VRPFRRLRPQTEERPPRCAPAKISIFISGDNLFILSRFTGTFYNRPANARGRPALKPAGLPLASEKTTAVLPPPLPDELFTLARHPFRIQPQYRGTTERPDGIFTSLFLVSGSILLHNQFERMQPFGIVGDHRQMSGNHHAF